MKTDYQPVKKDSEPIESNEKYNQPMFSSRDTTPNRIKLNPLNKTSSLNQSEVSMK